MIILPISLDDLIHARSIESARREFKKTWNKSIEDAVFRTLCAFANDLQNLNGGYVILGIEDQNGRPMLPPHGLDDLDVDRIQQEIRGGCRERIDPEYQPVVAPELFQQKQVIVIWAPPGDARPYQAREAGKGSDRHHYVRLASSTVQAKGELLNQLLQLTAKIPYDDRRRTDAPLSALSGDLLRQFLADVNSDLVAPGTQFTTDDLLRGLRLTARLNGTEAPRNVALLFFTEEPENYFPGARIEVVQFGDDAGGDLIEEKAFRGPLPRQIRNVLEFIDNLSADMVRKVPGQAEARRFVAFPYEALEEAISNAVLHRGYDAPPEPVKVYLYPDRLEITSYPGPVPGLRHEDLQPGARPPQAPMRNRRIGEFLKELRLAEMRGTGIPTIRRKMSENGSPEPLFDFNDERTYFRVTLPAHPEYVVLQALREAATLWATGERERAIEHLRAANRRLPHSGAIAAQLIEYAAAAGDVALAQAVFAAVERDARVGERRLAYLTMARVYLDRQEHATARRLLAQMPQPTAATDELELAILYKRSGDFEHAHKLFVVAYPRLQNDPKAVHEFAQTKMKLAAKAGRRGSHGRAASRRLNREASELLRRAIALAESPVRRGWAWFDLAHVLARLKSPESEIRDACEHAINALPDEPRFGDWLAQRDRKNPS